MLITEKRCPFDFCSVRQFLMAPCAATHVASYGDIIFLLFRSRWIEQKMDKISSHELATPNLAFVWMCTGDITERTAKALDEIIGPKFHY
jgi:hypothetical protein